MNELPTAGTGSSPFLLSEGRSVSQRIAELGTLRKYRPGEFVYRQGESSSYFHRVVSGRVRIFMSNPDGSERVLSYAEPEASFGECGCFDGIPRYASSVAVEPSEVLAISRGSVLAAAQNDPEILLEIARRLAHKQRVLSLHIATDGLPVRARVALLFNHLLDAYGEIEPDKSVRLSVRHRIDDLALLIGVTRVTMSRELSHFVSEGILLKVGRDIVIVDPAAIRTLASEYLM
ncbi:Crp/Fnr family transcriptional regulator [Rhodococcus sp. IEGM 1307]|jgi:CRP-like cAMP-binding protein|uniref:Crp/Fnr family transcriptional regulator n=1 Tax=Rhodococcus sp. IEGM 1307 TaxID=3047091 RepID=UPI0024B6E1D4|nr:Crp/Fnr family transcriptional regulator [Rhodococcus sp. IEGM 1307]MDI9978849.1 Crp/Fnr family transcriptional regulator [Rhodococcus sp. IEGM 1307]